MRFVMTLSVLLGACYASHGIDGDAGPRRDASRFDVPGFDVSSPDAFFADASGFDAPGFDAPVRDVGSDAGIDCRAIRLVERVRVEWPSVGCGAATSPRVTAVSGGAFQLLVTEDRRCRDRDSHLLTRRFGAEGGMGPETFVGVAQGIGSIASDGDEFVVCSGATLHTESLLETESLQPPCAFETRCTGLAFDGAGWGVGWTPGCSGGEVSRARFDGGQRETPINTGVMTAVVSVASSDRGFGALKQLGGLTLFDWPRSASVPTAHMFEVEGPQSGPAALSAWPFARDSWVVYTLEGEMLRARVIAATGEVFIDQLYDIAVPGYSPVQLRASSSPAGAAVVVSYAWAGGRVDFATRLLVLGSDGFPMFDDVAADLGHHSVDGADVVMSGRSLLLHRTAEAGDIGATEALRYECF